MAGTIGIKIANGDFYPLTEENLPSRKKIVLTTAHDGQSGVQIDLFRSISKTMLDAQYIGSLVVDNINPGLKGEASIEMIISSDSDGNISADAYDINAGEGIERHSLNVSLHSMDSTLSDDDFFDFELEDGASQLPVDSSGQKEKEREEKKFPWKVMAFATLFVILAVAGAWFFFLGGRDVLTERFGPLMERFSPLITQATPPPEAPPQAVAPIETPLPVPPPVTPPPPAVAPPPAEPPAVVQPPVVAPPPEPPPVIRAPEAPPAPRPETVQRTRPPAPVMSHRVPAVIPRNGVVYLIQWGDTLWDISAAFYRDPWLYPLIARHNNITNPDFIRAGFPIRIPPRN